MILKRKITSGDQFQIEVFTIVVGGVLCFCFGYHLISKSFSLPYLQILEFIGGIFFCLFGIFILSRIFKYDSILIRDEKALIKSILGYQKKTFDLNEIRFWLEVEEEHKGSKWHELTIVTDTFRYKIVSSKYDNYRRIKEILTQYGTVDPDLLNTKNRRFNFYGALVYFGFSISSVLLTFHTVDTYGDNVEIKQLTSIDDVIIIRPKLVSSGKSGYHLLIKLKSFPKFKFDISGNFMKATDAEEFVADVKMGDTIGLDVLTEVYDSKLLGKSMPSFSDRSINYLEVQVYGLRAGSKKYLKLQNLNAAIKNDSKFGLWIFPILSIFFSCAGVYCIRSMPKKT